MSERDMLAAAQGGDQGAFGRLIDPYRRELLAHCYRMLGSLPDAEDALQEALLGAWRGLPRFEGRSSLRSWLYTIATNACLKALRRRPKRVLPIDYGPPADPHDRQDTPLVESVWVDPVADEQLFGDDESARPDARYQQHESVELAFIAALQHLPHRQRAVLILRDVLGFSARETAEVLETEPTAVDSALQRAHKTVDARLPAQSQQATLRTLEDDELRAIVDGYMDAWERADVDAIVGMLADGASLTMPPQSEWYRGRDAIATFLATRPLTEGNRWRVVPTHANGQLAFGHYVERAEGFVAESVAVVTLRDTQIEDLTIFRTPELVERFGLPARLQGY
jgi:RNA polymerase sigma-70 factor, ECF subfamily